VRIEDSDATSADRRQSVSKSRRNQRRSDQKHDREDQPQPPEALLSQRRLETNANNSLDY
jgi:hypothetical protein